MGVVDKLSYPHILCTEPDTTFLTAHELLADVHSNYYKLMAIPTSPYCRRYAALVSKFDYCCCHLSRLVL